MKYKDTLALLDALRRLSRGSVRIVREGGADVARSVPYDLGANTRLALARVEATLRAAEEAYGAVRNGLLNSLSDGRGMLTPADASWPKWLTEAAALDAADAGVGPLPALTTGDLRLDINAIDATTLVDLAPILSDLTASSGS